MVRFITAALCTFTLIACGQYENIVPVPSELKQEEQGQEQEQAQQQAQVEPTDELLQELVEPGPSALTSSILAGYIPLPGYIEAEDYVDHFGIRIGETDDSGGSTYIGWLDDNDYTDYSILVPSAGSYTLTARVAGRSRTGQISFTANGQPVGSMEVTPTGDWDTWKTVSTTVTFQSSGIQTLRAAYSGSGSGLMNINWFNVEPVSSTADGELNKSRWVVSSNFNTNDAYFAIDGDDTTRWTTETKQENGQDFIIDLNARETFDRIHLDSTGSRDDHPRSYRVDVSADGSIWTPVAVGTGESNGETVIDFAEQTATHVRISQLGSTSRSWWSIFELNLSLLANSAVSPTPTSDWTIDSLEELYTAVQNNNQNIVLKAGNYSITDLIPRYFPVSGNNNKIDLTGVTIDFPVTETSEPHFLFTGSGNTLTNGTLENTYASDLDQVTDYVSYNEDRENLATGAGVHMKIEGNNNSIIGTKMIIKGSFPYGYGSYFGIGRVNTFGLSKRAGIDITPGQNTTIDGIQMYQESFGHGIYFGEGSDNTVIRNSIIVGAVRSTNDILSEGFGSLPYLAEYLDADGAPIPNDEVESLAEDGIRAYSGTGSVLVENSIVKNMRGGIRLYLSDSATVTNSLSINNGLSNFNMPRGSTVTGSSANFTYSSINDFRLARSDQNFEITILPSPDAVGAHNIADIQGDSHTLVFHRANGPEDTNEDRVIVVTGNNSTIRNETEYGILLESGTSGNVVISAGPVTDLGSNDVTQIDLEL